MAKKYKYTAVFIALDFKDLGTEVFLTYESDDFEELWQEAINLKNEYIDTYDHIIVRIFSSKKDGGYYLLESI